MDQALKELRRVQRDLLELRAELRLVERQLARVERELDREAGATAHNGAPLPVTVRQ